MDRSAGSWVGALVRGSEWIGAMFSLVRGSFVDRSDVHGSELSGSWIGALDSGSEWIGALDSGSDSFSLVRGLELTVIGSDWVGALVAWIGACYLLRCVAVRGSTLCCCVCVCFLFRFSLLSVLLCVEM